MNLRKSAGKIPRKSNSTRKIVKSVNRIALRARLFFPRGSRFVVSYMVKTLFLKDEDPDGLRG